MALGLARGIMPALNLVEAGSVNLIRQQYKARDGQTRKCERWYIQFRLPDRRRVRLAAFAEKRASADLGRRIEELVSLRCVGAALPADVRLWLDGLEERLKRKLIELGLATADEARPRAGIEEAVDAYLAHLRAKDDGESHIRRTLMHLETAAKALGWRRLSDIRAEAYMQWRTARKLAGAAPRTLNAHLASAKGFSTWAWRSGRTPEDPMRMVSRLNEALDRRRVRRALDEEEQEALVISARRSQRVWRGQIDGPARARLYLLAMTTGLRWAEIVSLRVADVALDTHPPTVTVRAGYSKRRREDVLALRSDVAEELRLQVEGKEAEDSLFGVTLYARPSEMLSADMAEVGGDADGLDFHTLRHTFISALARAGVHPKLAMDLARHSDINLTMRAYSHTVMADRARAVESLRVGGLHQGLHQTGGATGVA